MFCAASSNLSLTTPVVSSGDVDMVPEEDIPTIYYGDGDSMKSDGEEAEEEEAEEEEAEEEEANEVEAEDEEDDEVEAPMLPLLLPLSSSPPPLLPMRPAWQTDWSVSRAEWIFRLDGRMVAWVYQAYAFFGDWTLVDWDSGTICRSTTEPPPPRLEGAYGWMVRWARGSRRWLATGPAPPPLDRFH